MSELPHIPILRRGAAYESLDHIEVVDHRTGRPLAQVSQANAGIIRRDLQKAGQSREALARLSCEELLAICAKAGELFMNADLPLGRTTQSPRQYVEHLSATSGLPHALVRRNMAKIHQVLTQMPAILRGLTRGLDPAVIDRGVGEQAGAPVCFFPVADALGVVLPSNSPGVNSIWLPAVALKVPVVLKPGREEPWTPMRIVQALIAAGCPAEAFSFYPADHEGSAAILGGAPRALLFGDAGTTGQWAVDPRIQIHGPGWSKVILGEDAADDWPAYLDVLLASVCDNAGRSCINASTIVTPAHADEIADALAQRMAAIEPLPMEHEAAALAAFANPKFADAIDASIEAGLAVAGAEDVTKRHRADAFRSRKVVLGGSTFLRPTLVRCDSPEHPLAKTELLFPFASVLEVPQSELLGAIGPSLVVTAITRDAAFIDRLVRCPLIDRLNVGPLPTSRVTWDQPHEGNLFEFLYRRRAIQTAAPQAPAAAPGLARARA